MGIQLGQARGDNFAEAQDSKTEDVAFWPRDAGVTIIHIRILCTLHNQHTSFRCRSTIIYLA